MPSPNSPAPYPNDEIDLRELAYTLWASKWLIVLITAVFTAGAVAYALLTPPTYQAEVQTLPPPPSGLSSYNMAHQLSGPAIDAITGQNDQNARSENAVAQLSPEDAYNTFLRHVNSITLRQEFFTNTYLPAVQPEAADSETGRERLWKRFYRELTIILPQKAEDNNLMKLSLQGGEPNTIADWANQYVDLAIQTTQKQLVGDLASAIELRLSSVERQIQASREFGQQDKQHQTSRLKEALQLAEAIGLETPPSAGNLITSYSGDTLYLRGANALREELTLLEARDSDDPYIEGLPDLLKKQSLLESINLNPKNLMVALVDQAATPPEDPIKPKKPLIVALGFVLGGMLAVFWVLIRQTFRRQPE